MNKISGVGMVQQSQDNGRNLRKQSILISSKERSSQKNQRPRVLWFTGLSGAGKSVIANAVDEKLFQTGRHCYILDGDNVRYGLNRDLGFTDEDRIENIRRVTQVARLMMDAGLIVLVALISPFRQERADAREAIGEDNFLEIFIDTSLQTCEERDEKGLYAKARAGKIPNFTGISSIYEEPENPDLRLKTELHSIDELADLVVAKLEEDQI